MDQPSALGQRVAAFSWGSLAARLGLWLLPILLFSLILVIPYPFPLRPLGVAVRYNFIKTALVILIGFYFIFKIPSRKGWGVSFGAVLALFSLTLVGLWASGESTSSVIGSLLPWSDAGSYYQDALRLLEGGLFSPFSSWRPLFPGLLAGLLGLVGGNLPVAIALFSLLAGTACFLFTWEVNREQGALAASLVLLIVFFYYRQRISGMVLSEQLGLSFGVLGFAAILHGTACKRPFELFSGLFLVSLALNTRPGPFFVLPALALWMAWFLGGRTKRFWMALLLAGLAMLAAFAVNGFVRKLVSAEESLPFANFAYAFYGLVTGGQQWTAAVAEHPELTQITGTAHFVKVYELAFEALRQHPEGFVQGVLRNYGLFFSNTWFSVYGYMRGETDWLTLAVRLGLYALALIGIIQSIRSWRSPISQMVLLATAGLLASVPFVPPGDANGVRLYAAAMAMPALLPALGLAGLFRRIEPRLPVLGRRIAPIDSQPLYFAAFLVLLVTLSPLMVKALRQPAQFAGPECPAESRAAVLRLSPGAAINVLPESVFFLDRLPNFHEGRFIQGVHGLPSGPQMEAFLHVKAPTTIVEAVDLQTMAPLWLFADPALLNGKQGLLGVCGVLNTSTDVTQYGLLWANQVKVLSQP